MFPYAMLCDGPVVVSIGNELDSAFDLLGRGGKFAWRR